LLAIAAGVALGASGTDIEVSELTSREAEALLLVIAILLVVTTLLVAAVAARILKFASNGKDGRTS
jgi:hypothetical protein